MSASRKKSPIPVSDKAPDSTTVGQVTPNAVSVGVSLPASPVSKSASPLSFAPPSLVEQKTAKPNKDIIAAAVKKKLNSEGESSPVQVSSSRNPAPKADDPWIPLNSIIGTKWHIQEFVKGLRKKDYFKGGVNFTYDSDSINAKSPKALEDFVNKTFEGAIEFLDKFVSKITLNNIISAAQKQQDVLLIDNQELTREMVNNQSNSIQTLFYSVYTVKALPRNLLRNADGVDNALLKSILAVYTFFSIIASKFNTAFSDAAVVMNYTVSKTIENLQPMLDKKEEELLVIREQLRALNEHYQTLWDANEKNIQWIQVAKERLDYLEAEYARLQHEAETHSAQLVELENRAQAAESNAANLESENNNLKIQLATEKARLQQILDEHKAAEEKANNQNNQLAMEKAQLEQKVDNLESEIKTLSSNLNNTKTELHAAREQNTAMAAELVVSRAQSQKTNGRGQRYQELLSENISTTQNQIRTTEQIINANKTRASKLNGQWKGAIVGGIIGSLFTGVGVLGALGLIGKIAATIITVATLATPVGWIVAGVGGIVAISCLIGGVVAKQRENTLRAQINNQEIELSNQRKLLSDHEKEQAEAATQEPTPTPGVGVKNITIDLTGSNQNARAAIQQQQQRTIEESKVQQITSIKPIDIGRTVLNGSDNAPARRMRSKSV